MMSVNGDLELSGIPGLGPADPAEELRGRRERLPETAMALMEAIREASVSRKLTRQITRLLIVATEFLSSEKPISTEQRRAAAEALKAADTLLLRAVQKQWF